MTYQLLVGATFLNQLLRVFPRDLPMVKQKVDYLTQSPQVDSKTKKRLKNYRSDVYRIRAGDYRILYTYGSNWVKLLGVDLRRDVYDRGELIDVEEPNLDPAEANSREIEPASFEIPNVSYLRHLRVDAPDSDETKKRPVKSELSTRLDRQITPVMLARLRIDPDESVELLACTTVEDLIEAKVSDEVRNRVFDIATAPNYDMVLEQKSLVVPSIEDLERFHQGGLTNLHLKLDERQERVLSQLVNQNGPYFVNGPPGSGKTTLAVHAIKRLLESNTYRTGRIPPVLYATYTKTLEATAKHLLHELCGDLFQYVHVRTVDSLAVEAVRKRNGKLDIAKDHDLMGLLKTAAQNVLGPQSSMGADSVSLTAGTSMNWEYLYQEIEEVIVGRGLESFDDYKSPYQRTGRGVPLGERQREQVWAIHESYTCLLNERQIWSFPRVERRALLLSSAPQSWFHYGAVFIDEAQDLRPVALQMLMNLTERSIGTLGSFYILADPNQSIYGTGSAVSPLPAVGSKGGWHQYRLDTGHRTTQEIALAATQYLQALRGSELYSDRMTTKHPHRGPRPIVSVQSSEESELNRICKFLRSATKDLRVGFGQCAVLCPTEFAAERMERLLISWGIEAKYMRRDSLSLESPSLKVMVRHSSKGIEFPIVALALSQYTPFIGNGEQEREEMLQKERRINHMSMTRSMRSLLVTISAQQRRTSLMGMEEPLWEVEEFGVEAR